MNNFELENWLPMELSLGPPLPRFLGIYWPWYKPPALGEISVALKNPPAGSTGWDLYLYGANDTLRKHENLAATEPAIWDDVAAEEFPFQITIDVWKIKPAPENLLHHAQSKFPDYMNYYPNLLIHNPGAYNYNCDTRKFEGI